jgi:hypothetical protein
MKRKLMTAFFAAALMVASFTACGNEEEVQPEVTEEELAAAAEKQANKEKDPVQSMSEEAKETDPVMKKLNEMAGWYTGTSTSGETIFFAENGEEAVLAVGDTVYDGAEAVSEEKTAAGETVITVTDAESGEAFTWNLTYDVDGDYYQFDLGTDHGTADLIWCEKNEMFESLKRIELAAEAK